MNQWKNESRNLMVEEVKLYNSINDTIGQPIANGGLLRGLAKQFLAWSDKEPTDNGVLAKDAKLFLPEDKISDVFPNGVPEDARIYAVYYELNGYKTPFNDWQTTSLGSVASKLKNNINKNKVMINKSVNADDVLIGTDNYKVENTKDKLKVIDYYKQGNINEVVLNSEFEMDWTVAMLAYRNMYGSNQVRPILSRYYFKRFEKNKFFDEKDEWKNEDDIKGFSTLNGIDAGYTYVDLNMDFGTDEGLVIPEKLFLEFKSYTWRPLCVFGVKDNGDKEVLNIFGIDKTPKGNNPDAFKSLIIKDDPKTQFGVETKNYRKLTLRVVLRKWGGKDVNYVDDKIEETKIPRVEDKTRASELLSNMTLRVLGSKEGVAEDNLVRIKDEKAKELADGNASEELEVKGSIQGHVFADAGTVKKIFTFYLKSNTGIDLSESEKPVELSYVHGNANTNTSEQLTLDENYRGGRITSMDLMPGEAIDAYLYKPKRRGFTFKGWSYNRKHLDKVHYDDRIYEPTTIYAIWDEIEEEPEEIKGMTHKAYIFGYPDGTVRPNGEITRAEAAAMLARLLEIESIGSAEAPSFPDTPSAWYNKAINAVVQRGIMKGYPDGTFKPNDAITRAEFTQMISTIDNKPYGTAPFADVVGHWAERPIGSEYQAGRIAGYPDGTFRPDAHITRCEAAVILNKIFERNFDAMSLLKCKNPMMIKYFTDLDISFWGYNDLVEATNTHEYVRRVKGRVEENWLLIK